MHFKGYNNFVVFSDLHLHNYKRGETYPNSRLFDGLRCLENVFEQAVDNEADILFCGDLFDKQQSIPTVVINNTINTFKLLFNLYPNVRFFAISGNHDQASKPTNEGKFETALKHLDNIFDNFYLIDFKEIKVGDTKIYGIPYMPDKDNFDMCLSGVPDDVDILMIHQTDVHSSAGKIAGGEFDYIELCKRFEKNGKNPYIFCGHIHEYEQSLNFFQIGNSMHLDASDKDKQKYIFVISKWEGKLVRFDENFPRFTTDKQKSRSFDILIEETPIDMNTDKKELDYSFSTTLSNKDLVINYFNQVHGNDNYLLETGIKLV